MCVCKSLVCAQSTKKLQVTHFLQACNHGCHGGDVWCSWGRGQPLLHQGPALHNCVTLFHTLGKNCLEQLEELELRLILLNSFNNFILHMHG